MKTRNGLKFGGRSSTGLPSKTYVYVNEIGGEVVIDILSRVLSKNSELEAWVNSGYEPIYYYKDKVIMQRYTPFLLSTIDGIYECVLRLLEQYHD